jgi:photosystem II stability/assembly factor-like uncharacterized protein
MARQYTSMMAWPSTLLALSFALLVLVSAKTSEPTVVESTFPGEPVNMFYFDDSNTVLVTDKDAGRLYRSTDAGGTWKPVDSVAEGEVLDVFRSPFSNQVAAVMGRKKQHWITYDQGASWKGFRTLAFPSGPLSFHAKDPKKMLFSGKYCDGFACEKKVSSILAVLE